MLVKTDANIKRYFTSIGGGGLRQDYDSNFYVKREMIVHQPVESPGNFLPSNQ